MDMEKVAQGFELVVANIMLLSEKLGTDFYDAFAGSFPDFSRVPR